MTCRYQTWQKGRLWLRVTYPTAKPHIPSIMWLREFTWKMNFVISLHPRIITNYNKLKKNRILIIILLKCAFSDIINGCWMKFMAINAVTGLKDHFFLKKTKQRDKKIIFENNLIFLWFAILGEKNTLGA